MICKRIFSLFFPLLFSGMLFATTNDEYLAWWSTYRNTAKIPIELKQMEDHFISSGQIVYSSNFWNWLNSYNIQQITEYGYENFKQTVARNYFTWVGEVGRAYYQSISALALPLLVALPPKEMQKVHTLFTPAESANFNQMTELFLNYILKIGGGPYLQKLEEPLFGNPPCLYYEGRRISQDIFNSLLEYIPVSQNCALKEFSTIIEIGAGSGRTAFAFLTLAPQAKYVIVDFPPALYLSQTYLTAVFPERKVMKFRPFTRFEEVAEEYAQADIVFLMPDQLAKLPDQSADLFLAIDCLHEMKPERINHYFKEAGRLCSYMYFKCWQQTTVPFDEVSYSSESYPVPKTWRMLFKEPCGIPKDFFHAFYQIPKSIP